MKTRRHFSHRNQIVSAIGVLAVVTMSCEKPNQEQIARQAPKTVLTTELERPVDTPTSEGSAKVDKSGEVKRLISNLKDRNSLARFDAAYALGELGDRCAVEPLIACLEDEDESFCHTAVRALAKIGHSPVEPLIACLKHKKGRVRENAANVLGEVGDKRAVEPLITCLEDEDESVCKTAVRALAKVGHSPVESLITCLRHKEWWVRVHAADALGELQDKQAVRSLIACLDDEDERVGSAAGLALAKIGHSSVEPLIACLKHKEWQVRTHAAYALGELNDIQAVEPLITCLKDGTKPCDGVAYALGKLGDKRATDPLIACLKHDDHLVRTDAARALSKLGDERAVEPLIACLKDEHNDVRGEAAEALGKLGDKRAVEPLIDALLDWTTNRRIAAVLKQLGWKPVTDKERFYYRIAEGDKDALLTDWQQTRQLILVDTASQDTKRVRNAIYTMIALGKEDMVNDLVGILNSCEDTSIAKVYLTCGHKRLIAAAEEWAAKRGYTVTIGSGSSGPGWGSW